MGIDDAYVIHYLKLLTLYNRRVFEFSFNLATNFLKVRILGEEHDHCYKFLVEVIQKFNKQEIWLGHVRKIETPVGHLSLSYYIRLVHK